MENEQQRNEYIESLETSLDATPAETREFLWGDAYKNLLDAISKKFNFSETQKDKLDSFVFDTLTENIQQEEIPDRVAAIGVAEQDQDSLFEYIYDYFIDIGAQKAQDAAELNKKEDTAQSNIGTNSSDILSRLNQSFTAPATLAPIKRDVSTPSSGAESSPLPASSEKRIDPYREIPEV